MDTREIMFETLKVPLLVVALAIILVSVPGCRNGTAPSRVQTPPDGPTKVANSTSNVGENNGEDMNTRSKAQEHLLATMRSARKVSPKDWAPETRKLLQKVTSGTFVGMTREQMIEALGKPDPPSENQRGDELRWWLGVLPGVSPAKATPPALVIRSDESGAVVDSHIRYSK